MCLTYDVQYICAYYVYVYTMFERMKNKERTHAPESVSFNWRTKTLDSKLVGAIGCNFWLSLHSGSSF